MKQVVGAVASGSYHDELESPEQGWQSVVARIPFAPKHPVSGQDPRHTRPAGAGCSV